MKGDLARERWRLLLGPYGEEELPLSTGTSREIDESLEFLYSREYAGDRSLRPSPLREGSEDRKGNLSPSFPAVPEWISKVRELFPREAREILEKDALERYNLREMLTDPQVLERLEPNFALLKSLMQMRSLLRGEAVETARRLVAQVVEELRKKIESEVERSLRGKINRTAFGGRPSIRTIDFKRTILRNLKNYDPDRQRLIVENLVCHPRERRTVPWEIILLVDQSGSMANSVIYSTVMASIFWKLPLVRAKLVLFDTSIVDMTEQIDDPVETLMSVQLGGGTDITGALGYGTQLVENPSRTIMVLISDLFEGNSYSGMYRAARDLIESQVKLMVLTALDFNAVPEYDKRAAQTLTNMGAEVGALTPNQLADWVGDIIR
ncbi:MAG: VWA domain-containing protein [Spirochaetales bacterium]|nr:VWA domain-containing protein [Spirochaetales bacterium]